MRSIGSAQSVGNSATRPETRLVHGSSSSPVRVDTGTMARSGRSGSASGDSRYWRRPPAQMAITMSFTVPPVAFLSALTFSNDVVRMAKRRWLVIVLFHGGGGACVGGRGMRGPVGAPTVGDALHRPSGLPGGAPDAVDTCGVGDLADEPCLNPHGLEGISSQLDRRTPQQLHGLREGLRAPHGARSP